MNILTLLTKDFGSTSRLHCKFTVLQANLLGVELDKPVLSNAPTFFMQVPVDLDFAVRVYQGTLLLVFVDHDSIIVLSAL